MIDMAKAIVPLLRVLPIRTDYFIGLLEEVIQDGSVLIAKHFCEVLLDRANREKNTVVATQLHYYVSTFSKVVAGELGKPDPNESKVMIL